MAPDVEKVIDWDYVERVTSKTSLAKVLATRFEIFLESLEKTVPECNPRNIAADMVEKEVKDILELLKKEKRRSYEPRL